MWRALLVILVACSNPSRLDSKPAKDDPWATPTVKLDSGGGGFDLKRAIERVVESLKTPGPYEAPEHSPGFDAKQPHWGVLALGGDVVERKSYSFTGGHGTELRTVIDRLRALAHDDTLRGLVVRVRSFSISLPDVVELRTALHDARAAGKHVVCHAEDASNATYLVLTACEKIALAPLGDVAITGPAAMPIHVKPLLDKLGVQADFLHVGAYKGAAEPLTRDAPSKEMEETLGAILDRHYATMVDIIARERGIAAAQVRGLIDVALFTAPRAKAARLVDDVVPFEAFRDTAVAGGAWTKLDLQESLTDDVDLADAMRFFGALPPKQPAGPHVAVVYALGNIVDGNGDGVLGARQQIASHTLVAALRALAAEDDVKAVVLRIDSGGGSAQASELIWQAVKELKARKPVIVSMSDVAASGGYYIASGATRIYALADTLTGSIGVVGGKLAPSAALVKVGVNTFPMDRGKRATMNASLAPWSDDEKALIQGTMDEVYDVFVQRVAEGRGKTADQVKAIAQGRVWTGQQAKDLGLVDAIGGLDEALADARKLGQVTGDELEVYPPAPTLRDFVHGFTGVQTPFGLSSELSMLLGLAGSSELVGRARELVELALSFETTHVQALAILPVVR